MTVPGKPLLLGLQAAMVVVLLGCSQAASTSSASPTPGLTAAQQSQLALLEARPLKLPKAGADGKCTSGPISTITQYRDGSQTTELGSGPVYADGGTSYNGAKNRYFNVIFYTDPTVRGVVLVRGQQLAGPLKVLFLGPWAAGPVIGTDTLDGKNVELHGELALPADSPPADPQAAAGWGFWTVTQAVNQSFTGCVGFQIDTASGTEVVVAS